MRLAINLRRKIYSCFCSFPTHLEQIYFFPPIKVAINKTWYYIERENKHYTKKKAKQK